MSIRTVLSSLVLLTVISVSPNLMAQTPTITSTTPRAVSPGSTVDVTVRGSNLVGVTKLWTSFPCQAVLSPDVKDNGKNAASVVFKVTVPANASVGVHAIRVASPNGISKLKLLAVDDLPTVAQAAGNTTIAKAQVLTLPGAVDGSIASLAKNYYKFTVAANQSVSFEVLSRRFGSALDPMIRILDANGREVTYSDDAPGLSADSQLCHKFAAAGEYLLEIRDIRYQGGGNHFYRLRIGDFPCVTVPYPMGIKSGAPAKVAFAGEHIENVEPIDVNVPASATGHTINVGAKRKGGKSSGFVTLRISPNGEFLETEPNNERAKANPVTLGVNINGRFEQAGDIDQFTFAAKKGQKFIFSAITRSQGSPTDLHLRMFNDKGAQLAVAEDAGTNDGVMTYTFPADGNYTLSVEDLHLRGGTQFAYRVHVKESIPGFTLAASADSINVPAGGTAMITVTSARTGYNGPIAVVAIDLPAGITSSPTVIGPGLNTVVLTLQSAANAPTGQVFPAKIVGRAKVGDKDIETVASITAALKASFNGMPWPPELLANALAVSGAPKPAFSLRTEPAQIVFGRDLKASVKVISTRAAGNDEAITLAITPAKGGLPANVTAAVKPIAKGKNEIVIVFTATAKAPLGEFTAVFIGTHKKGKVTTTQPTPGIGLKLQAPYTLKIEAGDGNIKKAGQLKAKVTVVKNPAFNEAIVLTFQNLPKGVTAAAATIPKDKNEIEVVFTAAADAAVAAITNLTTKGDATIGKAKLTATSPAAKLQVIE